MRKWLYEPHHRGLPGHGTMIEFCASDDSMMGKVPRRLGYMLSDVLSPV